MDMVRQSIEQRLSEVESERASLLSQVETFDGEIGTLRDMLQLTKRGKRQTVVTAEPTPTKKRRSGPHKISWKEVPKTKMMRDIHNVVLPILKKRGYIEAAEAAKLIGRDNTTVVARGIAKYYGVNTTKIWGKSGLSRISVVYLRDKKGQVTKLGNARKKYRELGGHRVPPPPPKPTKEESNDADGCVWDSFNELFGYRKDVMEPVLTKLVKKKRLGPRMVRNSFHDDEWPKLSSAIFTKQKDWMKELGVPGQVFVLNDQTTPILHYRVRG